MRGRIVARAKQCTGCRACEIACSLAHARAQDLAEAIRETPAPRRRVRVQARDDGKIAFVRCQHCKTPKCVEACPTGAMYQTEDGLVLLNADECTACGACVEACPFQAVWLLPDESAVYKCDLCVTRLDRDEAPACVEACPTAALTFRLATEKATADKP